MIKEHALVSCTLRCSIASYIDPRPIFCDHTNKDESFVCICVGHLPLSKGKKKKKNSVALVFGALVPHWGQYTSAILGIFHEQNGIVFFIRHLYWCDIVGTIMSIQGYTALFPSNNNNNILRGYCIPVPYFEDFVHFLKK